MAVTMTTAANIMKDFYLPTVRQMLNVESDPFTAKIERTTEYVQGTNIIRAVEYGVNGGVAAIAETGALPTSSGNSYAKFTHTTKNLVANIGLSDKVIKATQSDRGSFLRVLDAEITGAMKASKHNFARQMYGDGTGKLFGLTANGSTSNTYTIATGANIYNIIEGNVIDIMTSSNAVKTNGGGKKVLSVDIAGGTFTTDGTAIAIDATDYVVIRGSYNLEITGLGEIFKSTGTLYGIDRATNQWLVPYLKATAGAYDDGLFQDAIDYIEFRGGSNCDFINASPDVRKFIIAYNATMKRFMNTLDLEGGFKALSFNGIPVYGNRFVPAGTADFYSSDNFAIDQMGEWDWTDGINGVLRQTSGYLTYEASLVKYCDLTCTQPTAQGRVSGITA